jgi:hypothetical protein
LKILISFKDGSAKPMSGELKHVTSELHAVRVELERHRFVTLIKDSGEEVVINTDAILSVSPEK